MKLRHLKTFESLFDDDAPSPPDELISELREIDEDNVGVLLSWFENLFTLEISDERKADDKLELFYRNPKAGDFNSMSAITERIRFNYPFIKNWFIKENISKGKLKTMSFTKALRKAKRWAQELIDHGIMVFDPYKFDVDKYPPELKPYEDKQIIDAKINSDKWAWLVINNVHADDHFVNTLYDSFPYNKCDLWEDTDMAFLFNKETLDLYSLINWYEDEIFAVSKNTTLEDGVELDGKVQFETINFIEDNMGESFETFHIDEDSNKSYFDKNMNWKIFGPVLKKYAKEEDLEKLFLQYVLYKNGASTKEEFYYHLTKKFKDLHVRDGKLLMDFEDLDYFTRFFDSDDQEFVKKIFDGDLDGMYDSGGFDWNDYWKLTTPETIKEITDSVNMKTTYQIEPEQLYNFLNLLCDARENDYGIDIEKRLNRAAANTQMLADESEAENTLHKTIKNNFEYFYDNNTKKYYLDVDKLLDEAFNKMFVEEEDYEIEAYSNFEEMLDDYIMEYGDMLSLDEPQYGFQGEPHPENWNGELLNVWYDITDYF